MEEIWIETIDRPEAFERLRHNWDAVYTADLEAQFSLSWVWQSCRLKWLNKCARSWSILAAKLSPAAPEYVAFFPLEISLARHRKGYLYNELETIGAIDIVHLGFICRPEYQEVVSLAFARFLQQEVWSVFTLEKLPQESRMDRFLNEFLKAGFELKPENSFNSLDEIDNDIVPYIPLPQSWEEYLQTAVSSNMRQKLRRLLRKMEGSDEFYITQVNAENLVQHISILLAFWTMNWQGRKGEDRCRYVITKAKHKFSYCFEQGCLDLPVLWRGDRPLGAIANLLDRQRKRVLFLMAGRDDRVQDFAPGLVLHACGIRDAIANGFEIYDFLMGNEAYKFSFGAKVCQTKTVTLRRPDSQHRLNLRTIPDAIERATRYQRKNELDKAEKSYRQILQVQPQHLEALHGLGVVLQRQGSSQEAEQLLRTILQVDPRSAKAWLSLGNLERAQGQLSEAETAYRAALVLDPDAMLAAAIYQNLGYTLQQQARWTEAVACYETAQTLQPDSQEAAVLLTNARYDRLTLPAEERARYAELNYELGNQHQQSGDLHLALYYYRQSLQLKPDRAAAYHQIGAIVQALGDGDSALAAYQQAFDLQPDSIEFDVSLANALYARGELPPERQVHYAAVNAELGDRYRQAGEWERAIASYQQSLVMNPDLPEAQYYLGVASYRKGNWGEAIAHYRLAQTLQPDNVKAELGIADVLYAQDRLSAKAQSHYAAIHYEVGNTRRRSGDLKSAIAHYRQAIKFQRDFLEAREQLRQALQEKDGVRIKVSYAKL